MDFKFKKEPFLFLILLFITLGAGIVIGRQTVKCEVCPPENIDFSLFWRAFNVLQEKFVAPQKIDIQKIIYGAISGMTETLDDPYTVFFNPKETEEFEKALAGVYEGVGMEVGVKKEQLTVIAPLKGTPAQKVGLRPGDKILKVDGKITSDLSIEKAVNLIRGPKGTEVVLTIARESWEEPRDIRIKRAKIKIPSLEWEFKKSNIVYIQIYQFNEPLISDFKKASTQILFSPAEKIILDLRNNPGGYLHTAVEIAGWFLEEGKIVVIENFGDKEENDTYKTDGNEKFSQYPMVILINEGSASASEILAESLRYHRGIKLIGKSSFGKGSVQEAVRLDDSLFKLTVAEWLTPNGESISEQGLDPDIEVELTEQDYQQGKDPQLEKAIEVLRGL